MDKKLLVETIEGSRIILRRQNVKFTDTMFEYVCKDKERLSQFLPWPKLMRTIKDQKDFIEKCNEKWENHDSSQYAIFTKENNVYMGNVGAFAYDWNHESCEIGYWILEEFEGKGYMSEAVEILEHVLFSTGFHRIQILCDPNNLKSINIPKRLNYIYEGTNRDFRKLGDHFSSLECYSKLSTDKLK